MLDITRVYMYPIFSANSKIQPRRTTLYSNPVTRFCLFVGVESMSVVRQMEASKREQLLTLIQIDSGILDGAILARFDGLLEEAAELAITPVIVPETEREKVLESLQAF